MKPGLIIGLVVAVAVLLALVVGLSLVLLQGNEAPPVAQQPPAATAPQPTATSQDSGQAATAQAAAPQPPIEPLTPPASPPARTTPLEREATSPVVEELRRARAAAEAKATAEAQAAATAAAKAAAQPSQEIIDWLARAKISGVKLSATESRVILNGKSYTVGEYVNFDLGLKVMIIQEKRVLFVDANDKKYLKRL
jgi:uncharacterized iron-regulated membrane protein